MEPVGGEAAECSGAQPEEGKSSPVQSSPVQRNGVVMEEAGMVQWQEDQESGIRNQESGTRTDKRQETQIRAPFSNYICGILSENVNSPFECEKLVALNALV
jgi:hypothetical protein